MRPVLSTVPLIEVSSQEALLDEDLTIVVRGAPPEIEILIQAEMLDDTGVFWRSWGLFQSDAFGEVDLSKSASLEGSYQGIDPMGLLWSMQPLESEKGVSFNTKKESFSIRISACLEKEKIASCELTRLRKSLDVKEIPIREEGLVGLLFLPPSEKPLPLIITLSGSNGGLEKNRAKLLASHGFATLGLAYFGVEGLPSSLKDIPLEYFEKAFTWVKNQPSIDSSHIGIYGVSRGAELALLLGSFFPEFIQAIGAVVPSSVIYGGFPEESAPAWLYQNKPLMPSSQISVEKITAALLLISGGDDQMWPSALYAAQIQQKLEAHHSSVFFEHLHYPEAGHGITIPNLPNPGPLYYHPIGKCWFPMGGTSLDNQHASQDSWKKTIAFFQKALVNEKL